MGTNVQSIEKINLQRVKARTCQKTFTDAERLFLREKYKRILNKFDRIESIEEIDLKLKKIATKRKKMELFVKFDEDYEIGGLATVIVFGSGLFPGVFAVASQSFMPLLLAPLGIGLVVPYAYTIVSERDLFDKMDILREYLEEKKEKLIKTPETKQSSKEEKKISEKIESNELSL